MFLQLVPLRPCTINRCLIRDNLKHALLTCNSLPCLPTISATCSELGTGTHSVILFVLGFCFIVFSSNKPVGGAGVDKLYVVLFKLLIDSSKATCKALFSSLKGRRFNASIILGGLAQVSSCRRK